jgi:hypothetical protein
LILNNEEITSRVYFNLSLLRVQEEGENAPDIVR